MTLPAQTIGKWLARLLIKLKAWADKYDWLAHGILAFLLCWINPLFSTGFMLGIEGTQIDIFGIKGRWRDTITDLIADGIGIELYLIIQIIF